MTSDRLDAAVSKLADAAVSTTELREETAVEPIGLDEFGRLELLAREASALADRIREDARAIADRAASLVAAV